MLSSPLSFRGRAFLGLAALALSVFLAAALPAEAPKSEQTLTLDQETPEQPVKAGEAHPWRIEVAPGTSVLVKIDQRSIGLVAELRIPGSKSPMVFGSGDDRWGPVVLLLETAGDYRIEVRPRDKAPWPGRYTIRAEAVPSAGAKHDALTLMSRAGREALPDTPESRKRAVATYRKALAKWQGLDERAGEAEALTSIAVLECYSSQLLPATADFEAALALWKELGSSQREAEVLSWLGPLYLDTQGTAKARDTFESAISQWRDLKERFNEAQTRTNLCGLKLRIGALTEALSCFQESLAFFHETGVPQEAEILNSIGGIYAGQGEPDDALASYQQALDLWHTLGDRDREATALNNIGALHRALGEWQEALRFYDRALAVLGPSGDRALTGSVLNNIGFIYNVLGEPKRALGYLEDALKLYRATGNRSKQIVALNNLGTAWRSLGDWKKALDYHQRALRLATRLGDAPQQATSLLSLAGLQIDHGEPSAALSGLDEALRILGEKGDRRIHIQAFYLRGQALRIAGRPQEALPVLQGALAQRRDLHDRAGEAETLDAVALVERSLGLTADALSHAQTSVDIIDELRSSFLTDPSLRASFLATRQRSFSLLIDLLMARSTADPGKSYDQAAFEISERAHARSLLDVLRAGHTASTAPAALLTQRSSLLRRLSAEVNQRWKESGAKAEALEKEIGETLAGIDRVEAEIRRNDPRFADFSAPQPVSPETIAGGLEPGTMLLEYSLGEDRSFLWAIERGRVRSFVLPPQAEIEALARRAYQEMSTAESGSTHRGGAMAALSRRLLGPLWNERTGESAGAPLQRLVVVPDGALTLLPFAALPVPDPGRSWKSPGRFLPLLERVEVVSIPSATTLAVQRQRPEEDAPTQWAAVFGDPVYAADDSRLARRAAADRSRPGEARGKTSAVAFPRLQATGREAAAIKALAPAGKVKLDLGLDATREAVLAGNLSDFRVLHFATHAVADTENPDLSGLVLSQVDAAGRPREGFLGLADIYGLDLHAGLVVLSGCRTALGKEVRGEGLIGLTRAFQYAGVPRVVASLWPVDDRTTEELMTRFYQAMWREHDRRAPAAALREAQRLLRQDPRYADPHSWAGFVFQGDWR